MSHDAMQGFNPVQVESWLQEHVPSFSPPISWKRLPGGHSNLTYLLVDSKKQRFVIRRPPLGGLLAKAHDMSREWSIIRALKTTNVPVPTAIAFCDDPCVTDAHFYVMEFVDGHALASVEDTIQYVPEALRKPLALNFIEVLAAIHNVDPDKVGLSGLGRTQGYIARQVGAWHRSWKASAESAGLDDNRVHELACLMLNSMPPEGPPRIVHGDFGLHNCLIDQKGSIAAVLDWEISTIGNPMSDLAHALLEFSEDPSVPPSNPAMATALPGFPSRSSLAEHYAKQTGIDIADLDFYYGFNLWRKAVIAQGVFARYKTGQKDAKDIDLEVFHVGIDSWLSRATLILKSWKG